MKNEMSEPVDAKEKDEKIEHYHVEDAFRHLMEAEKVKKNPKLLAKVKEHAKAQSQALQHIQDLDDGKAKSISDLKSIRSKMKTEY